MRTLDGKMKTEKQTAYIACAPGSRFGPVWAAVSERGLVAVKMQAGEQEFVELVKRLGFDLVVVDPDRAAGAASQVVEYLEGKRREFNMPIDWDRLLPFQKQALQATFAVPYGETTTYAEIARQIGRPRAARAVGRAEATNPIAPVVPCHRVLGSDGKLHGYGGPGGLGTKAWLLEMESQSKGT
ncbi:MAG: methylated-DNA--[protein]-cysteine S-methyltransferase [Chloroflexota bacterium]|nr:MAG: methylated-DNA--[protein]-cysteine S-methyltransferase [Chloroflexota bacterium]